MRSFLVGSLGLAVLLSSIGISSAAAQDRRRARQLYDQGQQLFSSGQYAAAESSFRAAYQASPNPVVLRAIATAQERQGNTAGAAQTLQQYLRENPNANDRAEVEARLRQWGGGRSTIAFSTTPPGAQIIIDGQPTGQMTPADVEVEPGAHTVQLTLEGYSTVQQQVTAGSGGRMRFDVALQAGGGTVEGGGLVEGGDGGGGGEGPPEPSIGVWIAAGVAALGLISGTVFGFLALNEQSKFDANPTAKAADRGELFALIADISFGVAGAAAITAIVLYIIDAATAGEEAPPAEEPPPLVRLNVTPWASPSGGGLAAQLRF